MAIVLAGTFTVFIVRGRSISARSAAELTRLSAEVESDWCSRSMERPTFARPPGDGNAAEFYLEALEMIRQAGERESTGAFAAMASAWPTKEAERRRLMAHLRDTADARALIARGITCRDCDFAAALGEDRLEGSREFAARLPEIEHGLMYLGRMMGVDANRLQAGGVSYEACRAALDGMAFASDLGRGGGLRGLALSIGLEHDLAGAVATLVGAGMLDEKGLRLVIERIEIIDRSRPGLAEAFGAERAILAGWARRTAPSTGLVPAPVDLAASGLAGVRPSTKVALSAGGLLERWRIADDWYRRTIVLAGVSPLGLPDEWEALAWRKAHMARDPLLAAATSPAVKAVDQTVEAAVARRCLIVSAALMLARLKTGAFPDGLEELVPDYLEALPKDPASDLDFGYRPATGDENAERILYSVGLDRKDDGGKLPTKAAEGTRKGGDIAYRLVAPPGSKNP